MKQVHFLCTSGFPLSFILAFLYCLYQDGLLNLNHIPLNAGISGAALIHSALLSTSHYAVGYSSLPWRACFSSVHRYPPFCLPLRVKLELFSVSLSPKGLTFAQHGQFRLVRQTYILFGTTKKNGVTPAKHAVPQDAWIYCLSRKVSVQRFTDLNTSISGLGILGLSLGGLKCISLAGRKRPHNINL